MNTFVIIANRVKLAVIVATAAIMVYALWVSKDHITDIALLIGLTGYQAKTLFILIDLPALIGKVIQLKYFARSTQRMGRKLMVASGTLSLVCNVLSGFHSGGWGAAGYGAFVVVMFLVLEGVVTKIKPSASVTRAKNAESETGEKVTAPKKSLKGSTWSVERRAAFEAKKLEKQFAMASAPVSGV